ncbi:Hvo_1808 family surface protein [Natronolimnohabitans sp. A-GB9]|uniref:Hvo_1808 family surface protein n=1 Tax=Natronolimnohabitans sp. A-GB9 TaxID=3069757 RepID=UPI0027AFDAF3|nr:Hvo_1808 family surface protein [Natronolimnohabitans sp. A-GB9]MDQ2052348.1 Hvo_1808 family surface protein [Natronolimnohabitans sp. A-GB9]
MTQSQTRTRIFAALVVAATVVLVVIAASGVAPPLFSDDRPAEPTTEDTVGYVEGYWHDDELAVDDGDDATLEDDDLESVVYRSMARVEEIRGLTFEEEVPVDVISREEFQADHDDVFVSLSDDQQLKQNVAYEALFMVDSETDASDELESMYGGTVLGYYEPTADRIVLVSDDPDEPDVDEVVLGHELTHALQDQHFDLTRFDGGTIDRETAETGLIEGDAVWVDTEYDERCGEEWSCLPDPESPGEQQADLNWGLYLTLYHPYSDGPSYVDQLRESGDGWDVVDAAYDDPPESSSTIIHHEAREPVAVDVPDRSSDAWEPLEIDGEVVTERVGEAAMVGMFGGDPLDPTTESVIDDEALLADDSSDYDYDQPYTNDWAGDELVTYVDADAGTNATADETGYVWETEWRSTEGAQEFATGYLELLELHDAEAVDDRQDTYVIDDEFPGAYYLEHDGETMTIVHAPSVDDLDAIASGAAPDGEDTVEQVDVAADDDSDSLSGFAVPGTVVTLGVAVIAVRRRARPVPERAEPTRVSTVDAASPLGHTTGPDASAGSSDPGRVRTTPL